jgi:hypothetical protein
MRPRIIRAGDPRRRIEEAVKVDSPKPTTAGKDKKAVPVKGAKTGAKKAAKKATARK